jgi:hypothetical protein
MSNKTTFEKFKSLTHRERISLIRDTIEYPYEEDDDGLIADFEPAYHELKSGDGVWHYKIFLVNFKTDRGLECFGLSKTYDKISNYLKNTYFNIAHDICKENQFIYLETLNIKDMKEQDNSVSEELQKFPLARFVEILILVARKYNSKIIFIEKWVLKRYAS